MTIPENPRRPAKPDISGTRSAAPQNPVMQGIAEVGTSILKTVTSPIFDQESQATIANRLKLDITDKPLNEPVSGREISYLIIDVKNLGGDQEKIIAEEVKILSKSRDFMIHQDQYGNLVLMSFSERGGIKMLLDIAASITGSNDHARIYVSDGQIENQETAGFRINGYPDCSPESKWRNTRAGIKIGASLFSKIQDPQSRVGSHIELETSEGTQHFVNLEGYRHKISLKTGGPDKLIGYEKEYKSLQTAITDDTTKLILLKGSAGMGKSRLLEETISRHPSVVFCSMDPSDKNVIGSSLATLASQLFYAITEDDKLNIDMVDQAIVHHVQERKAGEQSFVTITMVGFLGMSHAERVAYAAKNPQAVSDLCNNALRLINQGRAPNTVFVLEDLHHADRISEPFLHKIAEFYINSTRGKAVLSMRPEETYQSTAQRNLIHQTPADATGTVSLEHGLDFADEKISHDYAFHSIPASLRRERRLGEWHRKLGQLAKNSPWVMKTMMDAVLEKDKRGNYRHLIIDESTIEVTNELLRRLETIDPNSSTDIATYFHERIANLPSTPRQILQSIALMGNKATSKQIEEIWNMIMQQRFSPEDFMAAIGAIIEGGYIKKDELGTKYELQHESMQAIVLGSISDKEQKRRLATKLYAKIGDDLEPLAAHGLLTTITDTDKRTGAEKYLPALEKTTSECLKYADDKHDFDLTYNIATRTRASAGVKQIIVKAQEKEAKTPKAHLQFAVSILFAQAQSALFLGKFNEVDEVISILQKIHSNHPQAVDISHAHLLRFESAYMTSSPATMQKIYEHDLESGKHLPLIQQLIAEIKLAFKKGDNAKVIAIARENKQTLEAWNREYFQQKGIPQPEFVEIARMSKCRAPFGHIRQSAIDVDKPNGIRIDEDILRTPSTTDDRQKAELRAILEELELCGKILARYPLIMNPIYETSVPQQKAEIAAMLGNYDEAIELMGENIRISRQIGIQINAVRAAKLKGDIQVNKALFTEPIIQHDVIGQAISTYTEGINLADQIAKKN
ncbi:ATP-binding protein [Candidatus Peregrinibacteria bacterium]|nr:ATP-binding protein [Candidatus Peregrinibacteria bacterium]